MPEADDNRVAEGTDAVGVATQVDVVGTGGNRRDRRVGGLDLHVGDNAVLRTFRANDDAKGSAQPL
jgi:hypothetical protein